MGAEGELSGAGKLLALVFMAAVVAPNLVAVAIPAESWPYTNAPMFAHRVAPETPRYAFVFAGQTRAGDFVELGYYSAGARWSLLRLFFKFVYGAVPAGGAFCVYPDDDRTRLEERLSRFFEVFVDRYHARRADAEPLRSLVLGVTPLQGASNQRGAMRRLGVYDVARRSYTHEWESPS